MTIRKSATRLLSDESGYALVWVAAGMTSLMGMAAIAIDTGYLYAEQNQLQATADAAVLAATHEFTNGGSEQDVKDAAVDLARKNMPQARYGNVLADADVEFGQWDESTGFSSSSSGSANAVRVTVRRTAANGNGIDTFFAQILRNDSVDAVVQTVATIGAPGCSGTTHFTAGKKVQFGQDMRIDAGMCIYGREGVQAGQDPVVEEGAYIAALDEDTITFGQDPQMPDDAIGEADLQPTNAQNIDQIIDDIENGINLPPHITNVVVTNKMPKKNQIVSGTAYVITKSISINQDYTMTDVILASRESISFGQDGKIRNSLGECATGGNAIGLYAKKDISLGQDAVIEGAQLIAGESVSIGQDLKGFSASIEAGEDIDIGQDPEISNCDGAYASGGGSATVSARLVQ